MSQELLNACYQGNFNQVKGLLTDENNPVNIHYKNPSLKRNALMCACMSGHLDIISYLLKSEDLHEHSNLYDRDYYQRNAFIFACSYKQEDTIFYLIMECNFQIDEKTKRWLIFFDKQDVLSLIQAREMYQNMNDKFSYHHKVIKQRKI